MTRNRPIPHISEADHAYIRDLRVHEDTHVLAFDKPSGLPSQVRGNRARNLDHLLWAFAKSNGKRPRLVHRLDAGTSGIILAGRTKPAATALSTALEQRLAQKTYLALVSGALPHSDAGTVEATIARIPTDRGEQIVAGHTDGKPALTDWRILGRNGDCALVQLRPVTGRMHQLRVHMAHLGCAIIGDDRYGGANGARLMLHALEITLPHPANGAPTTFRAPIPGNLTDAARQNGLDMPLAGLASYR